MKTEKKNKETADNTKPKRTQKITVSLNQLKQTNQKKQQLQSNGENKIRSLAGKANSDNPEINLKGQERVQEFKQGQSSGSRKISRDNNENKKDYKYPIIKFSEQSSEVGKQGQAGQIDIDKQHEKPVLANLKDRKLLRRTNSQPIISSAIQIQLEDKHQITSIENHPHLVIKDYFSTSRQSEISQIIFKKINQLQKQEQIPDNSSSILAQGDLGQQKQCELCYLIKIVQKFDQPYSCNHEFCLKCLKKHSQQLIKQHRIIICPAQNCYEQIKQSSATFTSLKDKQKTKYKKVLYQLEIIQNPKLQLCPNPICQISGFITINQDNKKKGYCQNCKITYCLECMMKQHRGKCAKNQTQFLNDKYKYQKCSKCKQIIQRKQGCPHMTCLCGYQFCYGCGSTWRYGHNCWKNRIGNNKSVFTKIDQSLAFVQVQDININCFAYFVMNFPYYFLYFMLVFLWFSWTILFALVMYPLIFTGCFAFGYLFVLGSVCQKSGNQCKKFVGLFFLILFVPICFPVAGILCFIIFVKQKTYPFLIDPCIKGELFPIFKCRLS